MVMLFCCTLLGFLQGLYPRGWSGRGPHLCIREGSISCDSCAGWCWPLGKEKYVSQKVWKRKEPQWNTLGEYVCTWHVSTILYIRKYTHLHVITFCFAHPLQLFTMDGGCIIHNLGSGTGYSAHDLKSSTQKDLHIGRISEVPFAQRCTTLDMSLRSLTWWRPLRRGNVRKQKEVNDSWQVRIFLGISGGKWEEDLLQGAVAVTMPFSSLLNSFATSVTSAWHDADRGEKSWWSWHCHCRRFQGPGDGKESILSWHLWYPDSGQSGFWLANKERFEGDLLWQAMFIAAHFASFILIFHHFASYHSISYHR